MLGKKPRPKEAYPSAGWLQGQGALQTYCRIFQNQDNREHEYKNITFSASWGWRVASRGLEKITGHSP